MSSPKHTYTYSRVGIGDVIPLVPEGYPYSVQVEVPAGWTASYWYTDDPLASAHDLSSWLNWAGVGVPPISARKLLVNVLTATPALNGPKLKCTVSTDNYKAAAGLQYTNSGSHATPLVGTSTVIPFLSETPIWFEFSSTVLIGGNNAKSATCWKDTRKRDDTDRSQSGDGCLVIDNQGFLGGDIIDTSNSTRWLSNKTANPPAGPAEDMGALEGVSSAFIASSALGTWNIPTYTFEAAKGFSVFWIAAPDAPLAADNLVILRNAANDIEYLLAMGAGDTWRQNSIRNNTNALEPGIADQFVWGFISYTNVAALAVAFDVAGPLGLEPPQSSTALSSFTLGGGSTSIDLLLNQNFMAEIAFINRPIWNDRQQYIDYAIAKYTSITFPT